MTGVWRKAGETFRAGRNRLEPTVAGRVLRQLAGLGVINSSLQFAVVFTLGFIPFLRVLSAVLGSGLPSAIVIGNGFSWKALARRAEWLVGVAGLVTLQAGIGRAIEPRSGHMAVAGAQFLLATTFWWWSPHCLLSGQIPWRRLFPAGLATAVCYVGLSVYLAYVASPAILSNEAMYGPIGTVMTLVTAEIGLGVAVQLGAIIGAVAGRGKSGK